MAGTTSKTAELAIIPRPVHCERLPGEFRLSPATRIQITASDPRAQSLADLLSGYLKLQTGLDVAVVTAPSAESESSVIRLQTTRDSSSNAESYQLSIESNQITLDAAEPRGLAHAIQTLRQLIPAPAAPDGVTIPCCRIQDQPRYAWRGMLFDCCRHFMQKDFVKRIIDLLAYHKINTFHWHLTEDQGWRIEIKRFPKLTEIAAWRDQDGQRYGGFYTQDDVREIVAYADQRCITVVPEIEMPGHSLAALAAYPHCSCTGGPFTVANKSGIYEDVYCAGNEATFEFLTGVLDEVLELFPSQYIHIGGDESPITRWKDCPRCQQRIKDEGLRDEYELQHYLIKRIGNTLGERGRRIIGWDEILEGGLPPGATVQSWRGMDGAIAAVQQGHDVIASPTSHCYLDYAQAKLPSEHDFGFLTLEQCYSFEPTPAEFTPAQAAHLLGIEMNLWTERAPQDRVDHQLFPRLCALAEVAWSPATDRSFQEFSQRMETHYRRLDVLGVQYFAYPPDAPH
jgi:hexosaminidase